VIDIEEKDLINEVDKYLFPREIVQHSHDVHISDEDM
jgi:hypothetical protein